MNSFQVEVPPNPGLYASNGELFHHDPKIPAEVVFKDVIIGDHGNGFPEKIIQIDHIVTDTRGRRMVFTSFVEPYFFWERMYVAHEVGTSRELTHFGLLLKDARQKPLIENLYFYFDGRKCRALRCQGFPPAGDPPSCEKIFPIYEKHISPTMNLIAVEWTGVTGSNVWFIAEFFRWGVFESTDGTEYGINDSDKLCYELRPANVLWRHFVKLVGDKPGSPGVPNHIYCENVSPLMPIVFEPYQE